MNDLISVIVPVYNMQYRLSKCIESIINQTYKELEIILIDDGSTDDSGKICDEYAKVDSRIIVIHKNNEGVSVARNVGIETATGKYISFIDSDDYVSINYFDRLYKNICKKNVVLVCENGIDFDENSEFIHRKINDTMVLSKIEFLNIVLDEKYMTGVCWGKLYLSKYAKKIKFNNKYRIAEDLDFLINYIEKCNGYFLIIPYYDYYYYLGIGSVTRSGFNDKWNDEIEVCNNIIIKYQDSVIEPYAIKRFLRINTTILVNYALSEEQYFFYKNNVKKYFKKFLCYKTISIFDKLKILVMYFFFKIIFHVRRGLK